MGWLIITGIIAFLMWFAPDLILLTYFAILLAVFWHSLSGPLARFTHLPPNAALVCVLLALTALIGLFGWFAADALSVQFQELSKRLPEAVYHLHHWLENSQLGHALSSQATSISEWFSTKGILNRATSVVSATLGIVSSIVLLFFLALFFAINPDLYIKGFLKLIPPSRRAEISETIATLGSVLRWWLIGKSISMLVIGVATGCAFAWLGVKLTLIFAVMAGLFNFIPYLGPAIAFVLPVLLTLPQDPKLAGKVAIVYVGVQFIESNILTPLIEKKTVYLPPALTLFVQVLLGIMFGFMGILLASPLAATGMVLVKVLYIRDVLGEETKPFRDEGSGR